MTVITVTVISFNPVNIKGHQLNGQLMDSLLIFKCIMPHGTMKYTLKAHVCYFVLVVGLSHHLYSLHSDFYTSENMINTKT
jgi:hypothetical protein